jgi:hypothetical protein
MEGRNTLMPKALAGYLGLIVVMVLPTAGIAEDTYPTNIELVERAVRISADSMEVAPPAGTRPYLEIDAGSGSEASWLLDSVLKEELLGLGWRIRARSEPADTGSNREDGFLLRLRIVDLGLRYARTWRRYVLGGKVVERVARASIYYELIDQSADQIVASSRADSEVSDVVPTSRLAMLSNSKYPFASPEIEKGQWDRYLEGGLVIAIIGVLVYLFYSNKTAS